MWLLGTVGACIQVRGAVPCPPGGKGPLGTTTCTLTVPSPRGPTPGGPMALVTCGGRGRCAFVDTCTDSARAGREWKARQRQWRTGGTAVATYKCRGTAVCGGVGCRECGDRSGVRFQLVLGIPTQLLVSNREPAAGVSRDAG